MNIKSFRFKKRKIEFKKSFFLDSKICTSREIVNILIEIDNGISGVGEAVILESHGTESQTELNIALEKLSTSILSENLHSDFFDNIALFEKFNSTPALRSALEQAFFNVIMQSSGKNIAEIFNLNFDDFVKVNSVIPFSTKSKIIEAINLEVENSIDVIKLKLHSGCIREDLKLVKAIKKKFPQIKLRLDPNCSWKLQEANQYLSELLQLNFEYIEQPFAASHELLQFQSSSQIKIAADESASSVSEIKKLIDDGIKVIILKPITVGGIANSIDIINYAKSKNVDVIITSSFESNIGLQIPVLLSFCTNSKTSHGLNTAKYFSTNTISNRFEIFNGNIYSDSLTNPISSFYD